MKVIRGVLRLCFTVILIALMSIGLLTVLSYISPTAYSFLIEKLDTVSMLEYIPHDLSLPLTDIGLSESDPVSEETSDPVLDTVVSDAEEDGASDSECPVYDDCSESADPETKCQEFFNATRKKDDDFTRFPGLRGFQNSSLKCTWLLGQESSDNIRALLRQKKRTSDRMIESPHCYRSNKESSREIAPIIPEENTSILKLFDKDCHGYDVSTFHIIFKPITLRRDVNLFPVIVLNGGIYRFCLFSVPF